MKTSVKIFRDNYQRFMEIVESEGYTWPNGKRPTEVDLFKDENYVVIILNNFDQTITWAYEEDLPYEACDYTADWFLEKYGDLKDPFIKERPNADDLFERIDYEKIDNLHYKNSKTDSYINFSILNKNMSGHTLNKNMWGHTIWEALEIDRSLLDAINKKFEELGW